ncbi:MAG TPA: helix-turn-helix transcriptional regulator [Bauldia sp.]|nr:helix-turn-helix transcriptional regulator [Bauldia sp.]
MTDGIIPSSGNVFADLGFENAEEELLKAQLVRTIRALIKRRRLTQAKAGAALGLAQSDVSALINGKVARFSLERLLRCVRRLDREVAIVVRPTRRSRRERARTVRKAAA